MEWHLFVKYLASLSENLLSNDRSTWQQTFFIRDESMRLILRGYKPSELPLGTATVQNLTGTLGQGQTQASLETLTYLHVHFNI